MAHYHLDRTKVQTVEEIADFLALLFDNMPYDAYQAIVGRTPELAAYLTEDTSGA